MKLLREFCLRLAARHAPHSRNRIRRVWHVTVPAPRVRVDA
jgi:hypothetical protein